MGSEQWKTRLAVIESADLGPGRSYVTCLAAKGRAIRLALLHAIAELAAVRVSVTRGAGAVLKSKWQD